MPGLGQGHKPARHPAGGEDKHKLNNGVFSLMSLRLINFNPDLSAIFLG